MAYIPVKKDRSTVAETNLRWSEKQRMEAVNSYLLLGNLALTGRILNIPEVTLRVWKAQPWGKDAVTEIKASDKVQLSARIKKLVDGALTVVEDRLINGDFQFDQKSGEVIRKPVNMKDAHKVAIDMADKHEQIERSERPEQTEEHVEDKLLKLAEKFADMATKKIEQNNNASRTVNIEDVSTVEDDNAVPTDR